MTLAAISPAKARPVAPTPVRVVIITLDKHLNAVLSRASGRLGEAVPGLHVAVHAATEWMEDPAALAACVADIAQGDVILASQLFMEDQVRAILPALRARRDQCDAMVGIMSAGEVVKLTKLGALKMDGSDKGPLAALKKLRGSKSSSSGSGQMAVLRRLPKLLKYIPGAAQDLRNYFLTMQYWLSGSEANIAAMVRFLVDRYADGERRGLRGAVGADEPEDYPDVGLYHPRAPRRIVSAADAAADGRGHAGCRRPAPAALLRAFGRYRPLRRGDRRARSAGPARVAGLRQRPRRAAGDREVFRARRRAGGRRGGLAGRLLPGGRARLQRRERRRGHPLAARRALHRRPAAGVSDAGRLGPLGDRADVGGIHHHGGDPGARRRHRPDGLRRPLGRRRQTVPRAASATACIRARPRPRACSPAPSGPRRWPIGWTG